MCLLPIPSSSSSWWTPSKRDAVKVGNKEKKEEERGEDGGSGNETLSDARLSWTLCEKGHAPRRRRGLMAENACCGGSGGKERGEKKFSRTEMWGGARVLVSVCAVHVRIYSPPSPPPRPSGIPTAAAIYTIKVCGNSEHRVFCESRQNTLKVLTIPVWIMTINNNINE